MANAERKLESGIILPPGVTQERLVVARRIPERGSIEREVFESINVTIMGSPSVGKSSIGRELARITGMNYVDTDTEVEKRVGMPVGEFIDAYGRPEFYKQQDEVLKDVLDLQGYAIGLGGAMVERDRPDNLGRMRMKSVMTYIRARLETLVERTMKDYSYRPGLSHDKLINPDDETIELVRRKPAQVRAEHINRWNARHEAWETAHVDLSTDNLTIPQSAALLKQKIFNHVVRTSRAFDSFMGNNPRSIDNAS